MGENLSSGRKEGKEVTQGNWSLKSSSSCSRATFREAGSTEWIRGNETSSVHPCKDHTRDDKKKEMGGWRKQLKAEENEEGKKPPSGEERPSPSFHRSEGEATVSFSTLHEESKKENVFNQHGTTKKGNREITWRGKVGD